MAKEAKPTKKKRRRTPFLKSKLLFWIMMLVFFPLALFLLWRYKPYELVGRCVITLLLSFVLFSIPLGYHYYGEYEALTAEREAQEALINSDPLHGYRNEKLTLDQASFLKYYDLLAAEIDSYRAIDGNVSQLMKIVKENNKVNVNIMLAHMAAYEEKIASSLDNVEAIDLSTFSDAERDHFTQQKQAYTEILQNIQTAYKMLETGIGKDDVNSSNGAAAIISAQNNTVTELYNQLKLDANRLKVSLTTRKPLQDNQSQLAGDILNQGSSDSSLLLPGIAERSSDGSASEARLSLDGATSTMTIDINGTKIEGDIISIY